MPISVLPVISLCELGWESWGNGAERESIQKMVAGIAITANKILRSQGVNVAYWNWSYFPAALKKEFKIIEFLRTFRSRIGKIIR